MRLIALILILLFAGCARYTEPQLVTHPFEIEMTRNAVWTEGHEGYDPDLPGYHLTGDIATITLKPIAGELPDQLVLKITTSPGMRPNLEGFMVKSGDVAIQTFMGSELMQVNTPDSPRERIYWQTDDYFAFELADDAVLVIFQPKGMELLRRECVISWIDWYR